MEAKSIKNISVVGASSDSMKNEQSIKKEKLSARDTRSLRGMSVYVSLELSHWAKSPKKYCQKYTLTDCFFGDFARWDIRGEMWNENICSVFISFL